MPFCSPFDASLARSGPASVFLVDPEGLLRFDPTWTRDAWGRAPGPHPLDPCWLLARDRDSGFVFVVFVTAASLLTSHPRLDLRRVDDHAQARALLAEIGDPPLRSTPW